MNNINPKYKDKDIYKKAKAKVDKEHKKHSAYKSLALIKTYKDMGGKIDESKSKGGLRNWLNERWVNLTPYAEGLTNKKSTYKCGEKAPNQKSKSVCRPLKEAQKYNKQQIKKAVNIKNKGKRIDWNKL